MNSQLNTSCNVIEEMMNLIPELKLKPIPFSTIRTIEECVIVAERLEKDHGGILPSTSWLQNNGYVYIYRKMKKYPESFSHINQVRRKGNSLEEHIVDAKRLTKEHNGILPSPTWLNNNGYSGLVKFMKKYPKSFSNIKQDIKVEKTEKENIAYAEALAKKHGGVLPNTGWLRKNGYEYIDSYMRKYPELFTHIEQDKKIKTVKEHVADAKKLAKEHGDILPSPSWLRKNGYGGLYLCMRKNPRPFSNIKQSSKKGKTLEEWIVIYNDIIEKNNGLLPSSSWLKKNGYSGLIKCMRKNPKSFPIVEQYRKLKTKEEHVADAKRLAKEHNGVLPNFGWLKRNGYQGLNYCMKKYPELFSHIKQAGARRPAKV